MPFGTETSYGLGDRNIMDAMKSNKTHRIGLPKCLLEVKQPQYDTVTPFDLLFVDSIQKHQPLIARGHTAKILQRFCGRSLSVYKTPDGRHLKLPSVPDGPEYYTIPEVKSSLYVLRIFDVDETTIDGTSRLVDLLMEELNITAEELKDRQMDMVGDQLSNARVRSLQQLRFWDYSEHRMAFAGIKPGIFHVCQAFIDAIFRCNWGRYDGRDPGSLSRFVNELGRSGVNGNIPDFNACNRFVLQVFDAHVLAALITIANEWSVSAGQGRVKTANQLCKAVERNNWVGPLEEMVRRFFPMSTAHFLRSNCKATLLQAYLAKRAEIMEKKKSERTAQEIEFSTVKYKAKHITERCLESRDIVHENALIMLQQILVYKDFHDAMRGGHSGRMEKDLEIAKESGKGRQWWKAHELFMDQRSSQAVLDFLNSTEVGKTVPAAEEDAGSEALEWELWKKAERE